MFERLLEPQVRPVNVQIRIFILDSQECKVPSFMKILIRLLGITKTRLFNFDPLIPHFCIVKLGFTGVYVIFLILLKKHRLWVFVRTASSRRF